jgi:putative transposase
MKNQVLEPDTFFHFYNRGNNREVIFREDANYLYFLQLVKKYLLPISDVYSYCLLPNHFHFVLRIKAEKELPIEFKQGGKKLSQPLSNMFNAYAKAFNKKYSRRGSLFQEHPKQQKVDTKTYLRNLILYVNTNTSHYGIAEYESYPYSSYQALNSNGITMLKRKEVIDLFDDVANFNTCLTEKDTIIESVRGLSLEDED